MEKPNYSEELYKELTKKKDFEFYLSGPISTKMDTYITDFSKAELELKNKYGKNVSIFNPTEVSYNKNSSNDDIWKECMRKCIPAIIKSKAIYMLKDWQQSKGAKMELAIAEIYGLKIYYQ